ncbi:MAG TPA: ATP-binding cassette domain-containing protein [Castellaniella sp.]|uniref:ATP-binding cassette domain-containing protein n=1 Tax=Castellaniella sp. TaxID=1955812 RepID=UPI002EF9D705
MTTLEVAGLSKHFGGLQAVDHMAFSVDSGEILGLIGPNGSGKSTTLTLTMGITRADSGSVKLDGREIARLPTHEITKAGMTMVFQHSRPLRRQTVLENIQLALLPDTFFQWRISAKTNEQAREVAHRVGLDHVLHQRPASLPFADLRRLEVAKALASNPKVLLLDEPFAGLAPRETSEFSTLFLSMRDAGCAIVLVDHNVKAVAELVDRISVMHAGQKIFEGSPSDATQNARVKEVYFGKSLETAQPRQASATTDLARKPLLQAHITSMHYGKSEALRNIELDVHEGEFVSVIGLNGAGKTTLFNSILGFVNYTGDVRFHDQTLKARQPSAIASLGIALCPETRELFSYMSVRENLELGGHALDAAARVRQLGWVYGLFPILRERAGQSAHTLSGGEQQMLTIGRALMQKPHLLMLDEPTLGLAPKVIEDISSVLTRLQQESGLTVLLAEQNLTFSLKHSDRIYLLETGSLRWNGPAERFAAEVGQDLL